MTMQLKRTRSAMAVSLLTMAAACGGGASPHNQSTSTNEQVNGSTASTNMLEPEGNGSVEAPTTGPAPAETAAPAVPAETTEPAAAKGKSRSTAAPAVREPSARPKEAQRPAPRNDAAPRPAPKATPSPTTPATCTPEHRAMGHC